MRSAFHQESAADLSLVVQRGRTNRAGTVYHLWTAARGQRARTSRFTLPPDFGQWLSGQYSHIESDRMTRGLTPEGSPRDDLTTASMRGLGKELYKRSPEDFKDAFWGLVDASRQGQPFETITIRTNDPAFPWELVVPSPKEGESDFQFLGVDFQMARDHWSLSGPLAAGRRSLIVLDELRVIAPQYAGRQVLPAQEQEVEALTKVPGFQRSGGDLAAVRNLFESPPLGLVHFAGHGEVNDEAKTADRRYTLVLEDRALDLLSWRGLASKGWAERSVIFFNACQLGQAGLAAAFIDGWAPAMLESGAAGYIGGLWSLDDEGAARFATSFYKRIQERLEAGEEAKLTEILRATRREFLENGDPTFLSYVFYGQPDLVLIRP